MSQKNNQEHNSAEEIISQGEKFVEKNATALTIGVLVVIAIAFGIWAYIQFIANPREEKASASLFNAEEQFIAKGDNNTVLTSGGLSETGLLKVIEEFENTKAGNLAHAYAGIAYYDLEKYEEALAQLKEFSADEKMLAPSIVRLMGDCCVALDRLDEAADYFEKAASMASNDVVSPSCLLKAGHVYEAQKKWDKAINAYQTIVDKYYNTPEKDIAKANITRVKLQK